MKQFRENVFSDMMALELIIANIYTSYCEGLTDYVLFDGGAHRGYHTQKMAALAGCERVYAVEADPHMAETFRKLMKKNFSRGEIKKVELIEKALQNSPNCKSITWRSSSSHQGRSCMVTDNEKGTIWHARDDMIYREETTVPATTIDKILAPESRLVPFLKLDLEGADLMAVRGAKKTLQEKRPIIAFENSVHAPDVHGFTLMQMINYFNSLGYVPLNFLGQPMVKRNWFGLFEAWAAPIEKVSWLSEALAKNASEAFPS